jgi:addiction module RelB/DinJ family antitoxin
VILVITKTLQKQKNKKPAGKTSVIQTRIDPALREKTDTILTKLGLSTSDAIRMFLEQVILHRGLPFEVKLPLPPMNSALETPAWDEKAELKFKNALNSIDKKYGHALKKLADM